jgi:hypothetical protein
VRNDSEQVVPPENGGDYQHALRAHQQGDLVVAERRYQEILRRDPNHAGAWHFWTITLDEMGFVHSWQSRELDWEYDGSHYQGEAQTDKLTGGFHKHVYLNEYSYTGCGYSSQSSANWSEISDWENELTKRHTFSDATWPILWSGRFTSYEQSGCGVGGGSMGTSSSGCGCGCGYGESSTSDRYVYTGCWSESYDPGLLGYLLEGGIDNHVTGSEIAPGYSDSYDETLHSIRFYQPTFTPPSTFDYVYPTQVGMLRGGLGEGCGCGCGLWGFETWVPIGAHQDTTSTSTIGRLPSGGLIAPAPLSAAWAFHGYLRSARDVPESPHQVRAAGLSSFRAPNAIHGDGSPSLPQNEIFAAWGQWRERGRLNQDLEDAIDALANLIAPPASGTRPAKLEMPGVVVLDLYDTNQSDDQSVTLSVGSYFHDAAAPYALRAPEGPDALVEASLDGGGLTISVPDGSTADGLTAVTVVSKNTDGLPVSWTVLVHVVAVEGYTVQEQAWGETTWHAPEDRGDDWALLWRSNDYRWLAKTTFDGLVTAAYWTFAMMTVDSSRDRWAYDMTKSLGDIPVDPIVTFGGDTLYFQTLNVAHVGLKHADAPSAEQRQIAMTDIESVEWEEVAWSREVWIQDYQTSTGMAKLTTGYDGYLVYPHYRHHPEILQPLEHTTMRVKVELAEPVPDGMVGTLHLAWYDPDNTLGNEPAMPPAHNGRGRRDNAEDVELVKAGAPLPGFTLEFSTAGPSSTGDSIQKSYLAVKEARYADNFIVAAHPNEDIEKSYEFRENQSEEPVLMRPDNTGIWEELAMDHRTSILTIMPSVDIDTDSDDRGTVERSDWEEEIEDHPDYPGKRLFINWNDDNKNGIADWKESGPWLEGEKDKDLVPAILDFGLSTYEGLEGYRFYLIADPGLNVWADDRKTPLADAPNPPTGSSGIGEKDPLTDDVYWWTIGEDSFGGPLRTVWIEGIELGEHRVRWQLRHSDGSTVTIVARDTVKFRVEKIVWPDGAAEFDRALNTEEWPGFELGEGWYIEKSLEELINSGPGQQGYIRTHFPTEKTDKVLGDPEGANYTGVMGHTSHREHPAQTTEEYRNGFQMTVKFEFDGPEYVETFQRYVYDESETESPSFFQNSGVYIYDHYEVQIYNTEALMKAINAQDLNTFKVDVDGLTNQGIRADIVNNEVRLYHELDAEENPKYWTRGEAVSGCISGVPYKVPDVSNDPLGALQAAEQLINGSGSNTMVVVATPVDPANLEAGLELTVTLNGVETWDNPQVVDGTGSGKDEENVDGYVYLQSHWGSGVKFASAQITPLPPPSP